MFKTGSVRYLTGDGAATSQVEGETMNEQSVHRIQAWSDRKGQNCSREINQLADTNILRCLQCGSCSSGCPFVQAMDLPPNVLIRHLHYGFLDETLRSGTIWICVGCDTCASQCPMAIDIPAVMDALRQKSLASQQPASQPEIIRLHQAILRSIYRYGRAHKLEIMLRYKVRHKAWFEDLDLGLRMLSKRKLHLLPSKVMNVGQVQSLFSKQAHL